MAIGLGHLRLDPRAFWSMSIAEFSAAARMVLGPAADPPRRADLAALMARFPDRQLNPNP